MERVRDSRNDKSMEVLKQEIMKWRERERGRGETCASQGGQSQGESVVHLQLIHAFLPLCSKGAARRARPRVCVRDEKERIVISYLLCVNRTRLRLIIHSASFHSHAMKARVSE